MVVVHHSGESTNTVLCVPLFHVIANGNSCTEPKFIGLIIDLLTPHESHTTYCKLLMHTLGSDSAFLIV